MLPSAKFYDLFASSYTSYASQRDRYLARVDSYIVRHSPKITTLLDIGSGTGRRAEALAREIGAQKLVMIDNSRAMLDHCNKIETSLQTECFYRDISQPGFSLPRKFSVITCLWNVLGHIPTHENRLQALKNIASLLDTHGIVFLDVNNRYNLKEYGKAALKNIIWDRLTKNKSGLFPLQLTIEEKPLQTFVYISTHQEMKELIKQAGLAIKGYTFINYTTGQTETSPWAGQLVYKVSK